MAEMKAVVIYEPGGPEVLKVESRPIPSPEERTGADSRQGIRTEPFRDSSRGRAIRRE